MEGACQFGREGIYHQLSPKGTYPWHFGGVSSSLMERLSELEQELADTKAKILYSEPREVKLRLKDVRRFAEARVKHLRAILSGEPRIARGGDWEARSKNHAHTGGPHLNRFRNLGCAESVKSSIAASKIGSSIRQVTADSMGDASTV